MLHTDPRTPVSQQRLGGGAQLAPLPPVECGQHRCSLPRVGHADAEPMIGQQIDPWPTSLGDDLQPQRLPEAPPHLAADTTPDPRGRTARGCPLLLGDAGPVLLDPGPAVAHEAAQGTLGGPRWDREAHASVGGMDTEVHPLHAADGDLDLEVVDVDHAAPGHGAPGDRGACRGA